MSDTRLPETVVETTHRFDVLRRGWSRLHDLGSFGARRRVPLHRAEAFAPFFIVGSGRSGTTLTRRILRGIPGLRIPAESIDLGAITTAVRRNRAASWTDLVWMLLGAFAAHPEADTLQLDLPAIADDLDRLPAAERSVARIIDAVYRNGDAGVRHWGDKTVLNTLAMPEIVTLFPDARFVHLVRDGVDVAFSCVRAGRYDTVVEGALRWRNAVRTARTFARRHSHRVLELRYEELVSRPRDIVPRLCRFLNLPFTDGMLEVPDDVADAPDMQKHWRFHGAATTPIATDRIGWGRTMLDSDTRGTLDTLIGPELSDLGYARVA